MTATIRDTRAPLCRCGRRLPDWRIWATVPYQCVCGRHWRYHHARGWDRPVWQQRRLANLVDRLRRHSDVLHLDRRDGEE